MLDGEDAHRVRHFRCNATCDVPGTCVCEMVLFTENVDQVLEECPVLLTLL